MSSDKIRIEAMGKESGKAKKRKTMTKEMTEVSWERGCKPAKQDMGFC
jgi:hypothetical protein